MAEESKQFHEMIRILGKKFGVLENNKYSCCGITLAQCHALVGIGQAQAISLNELADAVNRENSTVSRTVQHLINDGFVIRDSAKEDRRFVALKLTPNGKVLFHSIENDLDQDFKAIFAKIPATKKDQVLESLSLIVDAVNQSGSY